MAEEISPLENHGWWMHQLRKDAKANRPEALRLADRLEHGRGDDVIYAKPAAAELRRLHAENERLHQINQSHEMKLSVRGYAIQIEDLRLAHAELRKVSGELLEALERLVVERKAGLASLAAWDQARAAIARAEGKT